MKEKEIENFLLFVYVHCFKTEYELVYNSCFFLLEKSFVYIINNQQIRFVACQVVILLFFSLQVLNPNYYIFLSGITEGYIQVLYVKQSNIVIKAMFIL